MGWGSRGEKGCRWAFLSSVFCHCFGGGGREGGWRLGGVVKWSGISCDDFVNI